MRKDARETAFRLIYSYLFDKKREESFDERLSSIDDVVLTEDDKAYVKDVFLGVVENENELSGIIEKYAIGFKADRIYMVDRAILLVAVYELSRRDDIPDKVSCNEAVELAKKYSTEKSPSFINGILAGVLKDGL